MNTVKQQIINVFDNKPNNFKESLKREFTKPEPNIAVLEIYKERNRLIDEIFNDLIKNDGLIFEEVDDLKRLIEKTLFNYLN